MQTRLQNASLFPIYFGPCRLSIIWKQHLILHADLVSPPVVHLWTPLFPIRNMTADNTTQASPTAHPAKRVKLDEPTTITTTTNAMAAPLLQIKKLSEKARLPTRGSAFAAGYDIYASKATTVPARGKALVDTDISMACPAGTCKRALLPPRSPRSHG